MEDLGISIIGDATGCFERTDAKVDANRKTSDVQKEDL